MTAAQYIARALWFFPVLMIVLAINQTKVAFDLRETLASGSEAVAEVTAYEKSDRVDVTYDYVSLRIPLADGTELVKEKVSLPHTLIPRLQDQATLDVRVLPGAAQEVVITQIAATQSRIAAMNAGICGVMAILLVVGVVAWNRYLSRKGDPSQQAPEETAFSKAMEAR